MFSFGAISSAPFSDTGSVSPNIIVLVTGVEATGNVGTVTVTGVTTFVSVTGVSATGNVGTVTTSVSITCSVSGLSAIGEVGDVFVLAVHVPNQDPNYIEIVPTQDPNYDCEKPDQAPIWTEGTI